MIPLNRLHFGHVRGSGRFLRRPFDVAINEIWGWGCVGRVPNGILVLRF